jgi:hypothetical protein
MNIYYFATNFRANNFCDVEWLNIQVWKKMAVLSSVQTTCARALVDLQVSYSRGLDSKGSGG